MLILGLCMLIIGILLFIYSVNSLNNTKKINDSVIEQNKQIENENSILRQNHSSLLFDMEAINKDIAQKKEQLEDIQSNITASTKAKEELSQKAFENYCNILERQYKEAEEEQQQLIDSLQTAYSDLQLQLMQEADQAKADLDKIQATRAAALQASIREKEIEANKDNFRLNLSELALKDIKLLKSIQNDIANAIVIDKIIWSNYYQPLAKAKFPKIIGKPTVCGIYKITSLISGLCYIGQSLDCCERWKQHCKNALGVGNATGGTKLYQAIKEDGLNNFTFEILEECEPKYLDEKEKYYIDLYDSYNFGLNGNRGNG